MTAPGLPFGPLYNRLTFCAGDLLWSRATRKLLNGWRESMGLAEIPSFSFPYRNLHGYPVPTLYAYSPLVAPKPADWDGDKYLTGYWFRDSKTDWQPEGALMDFLAAGSKPVYIGFGSMVGGSFQQAIDVVLESLRITKQRAILSAGWGNLRDHHLPEYIHPVGFVQHEWLFPRVAAVVHHGGAGTTAAGLRAGIPTIVVPFGGDQPYWGERVYHLGVGPKPIPRKKLNVRNLSSAVSQVVGDQTMIRQAADLGRKLQFEDGVGNAVEITERLSHSILER
jgi:sterol 3beta-glucosyltransferase